MAISQSLQNAQKELANRRKLDGVSVLTLPVIERVSLPDSPQPIRPSAQVRIEPTLAAAFLRHDLSAPARYWLLFRALDVAGRGWVHIDDIRAAFAHDKASRRVNGWARIRQILRRGNSVTWKRDEKGRIWIYSPADVALALGCGRLGGKPSLIPVTCLQGSIADVRAYLYASFHAGRRRAQSSSSPITREIITGLTGVSARAQRYYDLRAGTKATVNYAKIGKRKEADIQETLFDHGQVLEKNSFTWFDSRGVFGHRNGAYVVKRMPNTYEAALTPCGRGRRRQYNKKIDLDYCGARGNGLDVTRLFYHDRKAANVAFARDPSQELYLQKLETGSHGFWDRMA